MRSNSGSGFGVIKKFGLDHSGRGVCFRANTGYRVSGLRGQFKEHEAFCSAGKDIRSQKSSKSLVEDGKNKNKGIGIGFGSFKPFCCRNLTNKDEILRTTKFEEQGVENKGLGGLRTIGLRSERGHRMVDGRNGVMEQKISVIRGSRDHNHNGCIPNRLGGSHEWPEESRFLDSQRMEMEQYEEIDSGGTSTKILTESSYRKNNFDSFRQRYNGKLSKSHGRTDSLFDRGSKKDLELVPGQWIKLQADIPGRENKLADYLSRYLDRNDWRLHPEIF